MTCTKKFTLLALFNHRVGVYSHQGTDNRQFEQLNGIMVALWGCFSIPCLVRGRRVPSVARSSLMGPFWCGVA
ncbi:hypothetical protein AMD24_00237 [Candidatus Xiphinematobacter sp. Idaho Grape]|nr:hypothetical protein AMD24_00237 [Candidatus Xiphinematobacter sp. Idaho Grape]